MKEVCQRQSIYVYASMDGCRLRFCYFPKCESKDPRVQLERQTAIERGYPLFARYTGARLEILETMTEAR